MSSSVLFSLSSLPSPPFSRLSLPLPPLLSHLSPSPVSVSLLKPKCCCEGREPLKSEWPLPLAGQAQREGRAPGAWRGCPTLPGEADGSLGCHPGPRGLSVLFLSCLPSPTWEMKLSGWAMEAAETQLFQGSRGALSGKWWSGCPSHPGTDGAWHAVDPSSPECKHLR